MMNEETSDDNHEPSNEQEDSDLSTPDSSSVKHIHKKMKRSPDDTSDID